MLRRTTPDGGRIDDAALTHWHGGVPRRNDGAALLFAIVLVLFFARLAGCLIPV